jgi:hypothetical protein
MSPISRKTVAQGSRNTASTSKTTKISAKT